MAPKNTLSLGKLGEELAQKYLRNKGYQILETNFKNAFGRQLGEIDLIAKKDGGLVFVEVKTRKITNFNQILPEQNITAAKMYKLNKISQFYLRKHGLTDSPYRFDAVSILYDPLNKKAQIRHLQNIFI